MTSIDLEKILIYEEINGFKTSPDRERANDLRYGVMATLIEIESWYSKPIILKDTRTEEEKNKKKAKSLGKKPALVGDKLAWRQK